MHGAIIFQSTNDFFDAMFGPEPHDAVAAQCARGAEEETDMTEAKHTPGPWVASGTCDIRGSDNHIVGMVNPSGDRVSRERSAHDRALMIAAPDMLEALRDVVSTLDWVSGGSMEGRLRRVALAALAKATGAP